MEFNYCVILACLAFAIFLVVKEIKRGDKSRLSIRLLASMVMVACFALLIIPIRYTVKKEEPDGELNFFTEKSNPFTDLNYHLRAHPEIKKINIYGYGLRAEELKKIKNYQLSFHPLSIPSGFVSANWPKKIKATAQLTVQGIYQNSSTKTVKLKLFGLSTSLDSVTVKAGTKLNFSLHTSPKQIGKAVFSLIAMHDKDTLAAESVPFEVEPKEPLRVLILASSPDFEYKFLKKWLFENGSQVAYRGRISKDKYSTQFLNRKPVSLNQINQALLKDIDVVIIDEDEIKPELLAAVSNGMGLIVRVKAIKPVRNHQPLLTDTAGKVSVDSRLNGMGKIITTNVTSTYQLQLEGKEADYSQFWSLLFAKALRRKMETYSFNIEPQWPTIGEKARLTVSLSDNKPPLISIDSALIAPRQNMELPFAWDGLFWAKTPGWATLSINKKTQNTYFYKKGDWAAAKDFERLSATTDFVANQNEKSLNMPNTEQIAIEELNKLWFFVPFLVSMSFLWYEQRFLMNK